MLRLVVVALVLTAAGCATRPLAVGPGSSGDTNLYSDPERQIVVTIRDTRPSLRSPAGSTARVYGSAPVYRASAYAQRIMAALTQDYEIDWVTGWRIDLLDVHCAVFRAQSASARDIVLARLTHDSRVESVQPMQTFQTRSRVGEYNDPYFRLQKGVEAMRVPQAHQWSRGRGVSVAIIDTGVDLSHPELAGRIREARNFVDADAQRFRADRHGTAVAGVIAALTDNSTGIVGVAPASQLLALKACWHESDVAAAVCSTLTLAEAIAFAVRERVNVINLSLGGPRDPLLARLLDEAMKRGIVVVGASARDPAAQPGFPLEVPGVIAVTDADEPVFRASSTPEGHPDTPLAAPGQEVLTLVPGGRYDYVSGASISAALVSGVVALLLERSSGLSSTAVHSLLERTAHSPGHRSLLFVDACNAVASLVHAPACIDIRNTRATEQTPLCAAADRSGECRHTGAHPAVPEETAPATTRR